MFSETTRKLYEIVGEKRFLKIIDTIPGKIYIPSRHAVVRDIVTSNPQLFVREMSKSDNIKQAAARFDVSERTIYNWFRLALSGVNSDPIDITVRKVLPK